MIWSNVMYLLSSSTVINGGGGGDTAAPAAAEAAASTTSTAAGFFGGSGMMMIAVYAAVIGAMWFLMIRPQKKREKEVREMQEALKVGDNVLTTSGFYGRIVSTGEDCFIIEFGTNKGVRIPVRKTDIIGNKAPNLSGAPTE